MTIVNIRGTSGSGKSTLVHRLLQEHGNTGVVSIRRTLDNWKKEKVVAYEIVREPAIFVVGRYETQCGGCDAFSYKGSHDDIQAMVEEFAAQGNIIFEGLTISSSYGRWLKVSEKFPRKMVWAFMDTPEEVCYQRILARSGREPKRDARGLADYNRKFRGCVVQRGKLLEMGERVIDLSSDDAGYQKLLEVLE